MEALLDRQNSPNLSINVSIKPLDRRVLVAIALLGFILQAGVLVFAAFAQYRSRPRVLDEARPRGYGFPILVIGTLCLAVGMFLCTQLRF